MTSTAAKAAKEIKSKLRKIFPNTKFSVRSEYFAGGNAVNISWVDGPTVENVDAMVIIHQQGRFDGMTDSYEYTNQRDDIPQVKYISTRREMSDAVRQRIIANLKDKLGAENNIDDLSARNNEIDEWNNTLVYRVFYATNYDMGVF